MKKTRIVLLFFVLILITGCGANNIDYGTDPINLYDQLAQEQVRVLSKEESSYLRSVWQEADWKSGNTKTDYDYVFNLGDFRLRYLSDNGRFNDVTHNRTCEVTKEQRDYINSIIFGYSSNLSNLKEAGKLFVAHSVTAPEPIK